VWGGGHLRAGAGRLGREKKGGGVGWRAGVGGWGLVNRVVVCV
jgi:hypothetical protein